MNRVGLIGRLVRDPEKKNIGDYTKATFTMAVDRPFVNRDGKKEADFIDIVSWRKLAEVVAKNLSKGRLVAVEGRLQISSYEDRKGIRRKVAEIIADNVEFLDKPKEKNR